MNWATANKLTIFNNIFATVRRKIDFPNYEGQNIYLKHNEKMLRNLATFGKKFKFRNVKYF